MATFKIIWNIESIDSENPLEAAKEMQNWLQDKTTNWQFYVQNEETGEIFSVDLEEENNDAVIKVESNLENLKIAFDKLF
jgi:hypothetical protein